MHEAEGELKIVQQRPDDARQSQSHQAVQERLDDVEQDVRENRRYVEAAEVGNDAPEGRENGRAQLITITTIAALRIVKVQLTSRWKIPAAPS
jgi:hypothetical protein